MTLKQDVDRLNKEIFGNGQPGMKAKFEVLVNEMKWTKRLFFVITALAVKIGAFPDISLTQIFK
jgi:hypothetical protein